MPHPGQTVPKVCKRCDVCFSIPKWKDNQGKGIYCSKKCHNFKVAVDRRCVVCRITFTVPGWRLKRKNGAKYCGAVCLNKGIDRSKCANFLLTSPLTKYQRFQKGELNPSWRGGVKDANQKARSSHSYSLWRTAVFKRDGYSCQECGVRGSGNLNADHIKPFALYPELRFEISNGRTLCIDCHKLTPTYGRAALKYKEVHYAS